MNKKIQFETISIASKLNTLDIFLFELNKDTGITGS